MGQRALVRDRCKQKQRPHLCRLCNQSGHRQESCPSVAGQKIRELQKQLRALRQSRTKQPFPQKVQNRLRKDKCYRRTASLGYKGSKGVQREVPKRGKNRREEFLAERKAEESPEAAWRQLQKLGLCGEAKLCGHCGSKDVVRSQGAARCPKNIYMVCKSCHTYTNCLWDSAFRGTKLGPQEVLEVVMQYVRGKFMQRPTPDDISQQTGLGRWAVTSVVNTLLKAEALLGKQKNKVKLKGRNLEADATALRKTFCKKTGDDGQKHVAKAPGQDVDKHN